MRAHRFLPLFLLAAVATWVAGGRPALAGPPGVHEDPRVGYKIRTPKGWTLVPMRPDEKWIVAKYLSDRSYTWTDPTDGMTWDHKPDMTVIIFVAEVVKKRGVDVEETEEGDILVELNNPFKDYEDYLRRTYSGGGWFIESDEKGELDGVPVRKLEIKVEKLTSNGPKRIFTWIFHTEEVDIAVQFEVLDTQAAKLRPDVLSCLKSFKLIPRSKGGLVQATTEGTKKKIVDESKLTPAERTAQRKEQEEVAHRKAQEALPPDWTGKVMGRFLVLNHADEKYAKKTVAHAEAVWSWLDKQFAYVGPGEYVPRPILRICKDSDEERAFQSGTSWGTGLDITTHEDKGSGAMSFEFEWVNRRLVDIWFHNRSPGLMVAAPYWIDNGLHQVLGTARSKGANLEFKVDDWERDGLRELVRTEQLAPLKQLVMLGAEAFYEQQHRSKHAASFVRYLLASKKGEEILKRYLLALDGIVKEEEKKEAERREKAAEAAGGADEPDSEEEEEERLKARREEWKKREQELLQKAFDAAFPGWGDKDWKKLEDDYRKGL